MHRESSARDLVALILICVVDTDKTKVVAKTKKIEKNNETFLYKLIADNLERVTRSISGQWGGGASYLRKAWHSFLS